MAFGSSNLSPSTGVLQYGVRTLALCNQACLNYNDPSTGNPCVRFTYNANQFVADPNSLCYLYTSGQDAVIANAVGYTLYVRKLCSNLPFSTTLREFDVFFETTAARCSSSMLYRICPSVCPSVCHVCGLGLYRVRSVETPLLSFENPNFLVSEKARLVDIGHPNSTKFGGANGEL